MSIPKSEKETTVVYNEQDELATVWTASTPVQRRLARFGLTGRPVGIGLQFELPKRWVRISKPRVVSAEQREAMRQTAISHGFGKVRTFVGAPNPENTAQGTGEVVGDENPQPMLASTAVLSATAA